MSVIAFASVTGSPGVTTTAVGAWMSWPRPALLVEADTHALSAVLPGLLRGKYDNSRNLSQAMVLHARGELTAADLLNPALPLSLALHDLPADTALPHPAPAQGEKRWLLPAFDDLDAAAGSPTLWGRMVPVGAQLHDAGVDLLVDVGRLTRPDPRQPLLDAAQLLVIVAVTTLPYLYRTIPRIAELRARLASIGQASALRLVLIDTGGEVTARDFEKQCGIPVAGVLPFAPRPAAEYSSGRADRRRSGYKTAIRTLARELHGLAATTAQPAGVAHV